MDYPYTSEARPPQANATFFILLQSAKKALTTRARLLREPRHKPLVPRLRLLGAREVTNARTLRHRRRADALGHPKREEANGVVRGPVGDRVCGTLFIAVAILVRRPRKRRGGLGQVGFGWTSI